MKILSAEDIRNWDQYTIAQEPIASIDLMERAATRCVNWLLAHYPAAPSFSIICGKGNNGGDGLAIARLLLEKQYAVTVQVLEFGQQGTPDFQTNLARLHRLPQAEIHFIQGEQHFHSFPPGQLIIDALFGSGLNRGLDGITAKLVDHINDSGREIVAIDIPSGLFTDRSSKGHTCVKANHTLSFQCYKPAFLFAENQEAIGHVHILDIGLHPAFYPTIRNRMEWVDRELIAGYYKPRKAFAHKGNFGHALLVAGSYGKMGAALLSARACLRAGVGLVTCHIPRCGYAILQSALPEAMVSADPAEPMNTAITEELSVFDAIGIGPGIGQASETRTLLQELLEKCSQPLVIDADAINLLASRKELLSMLPPNSILTPHPKEFERLFGSSANDFEAAELAKRKADELHVVIVLKGHRSLIAIPEEEKMFFNSTGNPGLATAGTGDALTGILTALLAQGYSAKASALLGVYLHGLAGDLAAGRYGQEAMIAGDLIESLGAAFREIRETGNYQ